MYRTKLITGIFCGLFSIVTVYAQNHEPNSENQYNLTSEQKQRLINHVKTLNELTERRRVNTFFTNRQSIQHGLQKGLVNTSRGNLTFSRRDMVVVGQIPILVSRIYDSSRTKVGDFGPGWFLTLAESIKPNTTAQFIYTNSNATDILLSPVTNVDSQSNITTVHYMPAQGEVTGISSAVKINEELQINFQSGWQKTFKKLAHAYLLTSIKDPFDNKITIHYTQDKISRISGGNGRYISVERDEHGRISQIFDESQRRVIYAYKKGLLSKITDIGGNTWHYTYSNNQQLKMVIDPVGHKSARFTFNESGQVKSTNIRAIKHRYQYQQNKTTVTDQHDNNTIFKHNEQGITISVINSIGLSSQITLNENNQIKQLQLNDKTIAEFTYGDSTKPTKLYYRKVDGNFETQAFTYDAQQRLTQIKVNDVVQAEYIFNVKGQPLSTFYNRVKRSYHYDTKGNVINLNIDDGSNKVHHIFAYTNDGLLSKYSKNQNTATFDYHADGKLSSVIFPNGPKHQYQYDTLGFRKLTTRSDGNQLDYSYDSTGNLAQLISSDAQGQTQRKEIKLDKNNKFKQLIINGQHAMNVNYTGKGNPNIITQSNEGQSNFSYDPFGRLISIVDELGEPISYQYADGEEDIRQQLDSRTMPVNVNAEDLTLSATLYARTVKTLWRSIVWNESLGRLSLITNESKLAPDTLFLSTLKRRRLNDAISNVRQDQIAFDKPSSSFFLPSEYQTINCDFVYCALYGVLLDLPGTVYVNQLKVFTALAIGDYDCNPEYTFLVDNVVKARGLSGWFPYTFTSTGNHNVQVNAECTCRDDPVKFVK